MWLAAAEDSLPNSIGRPPEAVDGSIVAATPPWRVPITVPEPETPEVDATDVPSALDHPAAVPGGAVLLGIPLLGLLRRRTRERLS
jgi:hypothetical protein